MASSLLPLLRNMLTVGVLLVLVRGVSLLKEVYLANYFGLNALLDAYNITMGLLGWLPTALLAVATSLLIPTFVRAESSLEKNNLVWLSEVLAASMLLGVAFVLLSIFGGVYLAPYFFAPGQTSSLAASLLVQLSPVPLVLLLSGVVSIFLQARSHRLVNLGDAFPPFLIVVVVYLGLFSDVSGTALVVGTLLGYGLQLLVVTRMLPTDFFASLRFPVGATHPNWRLLKVGAAYLFAVQVLLGLSIFFDQYFASTFGEGSIASVGIANRVVSTICGVGQLVIIRTLLPEFAVNRSRTGPAAKLAWRSVFLMLVVGCCFTMFLYAMAEPIIRYLFERGQFVPSNTAVVAGLLGLSSLQIPFFLAAMVLVQYLHSLGKSAQVAAIGLQHLIVKLLACIVLVPRFGLSGVVLSDTVVYLISLATLAFLSYRANTAR